VGADGVRDKCSVYDVNWAEFLNQHNNDSLNPDPTWKIVPCTGRWEYNYTDVPYATIATEVSAILRA
jgi:hypothetical protein